MEMRSGSILKFAGECIIEYECIRYGKKGPLEPFLEAEMKLATSFGSIFGFIFGVISELSTLPPTNASGTARSGRSNRSSRKR